TNGTGGFTPLNPRQPLTPAPYAIAAQNFTGTLSATQLSGVLPPGLLSGTYSAALTLNNPGNSFAGDGSGLTGVHAITLGGLGVGSFWRLDGNAATTSANFLGTTDDQPLELRVNNLIGFRLDPVFDGSVNVVGGFNCQAMGAGMTI